MEFSYRLSEAEYLRAWKLRREAAHGSRAVKTVLFWFFILICLMLLWAVVNKSSKPHQNQIEAPQAASHDSGANSTEGPTAERHTNVEHALLVNVSPFLLLLVVWVFMLRQLGPTTVCRMYRKDPTMQGEFTVNITAQSISIRNSVGTSNSSGWNVYDYWREGKGLIVLVFFSGAYSTLNLAGLSELQQNELRGILASALAKR